MRAEEIILSHLRAVGSITDTEAASAYHVQDLAKRIGVLQRDGHSIAAEVMIQGGCCPLYDPPSVRYRLDESGHTGRK